jgi:hypothetical protein
LLLLALLLPVGRTTPCAAPPVLLLLPRPAAASQSVADMLLSESDWLRNGRPGAGKTSMSFVKS